MTVFQRGNFLLPFNVELNKWSVIACDQFTSQSEYWHEVENLVGDAPSTLHLTLPEVYLNGEYSDRIQKINANMQNYLQQGIFTEYKDAYIYVERTLQNGKIRKGVIGCVDLEKYDYTQNAKSLIRATEQTVLERIPPRKKIRERATLETSHILLLCNDIKKRLVENIAECKNSLPLLYDFDLMQCGGHITGWLVQGADAQNFEKHLEEYAKDIKEKYVGSEPMFFAVGDGNHSLCTAKFCYEAEKAATGRIDLPSRYAMVELQNLQDEVQQFEPIHRLVTDVDVQKLLQDLQKLAAVDGHKIEYVTNSQQGTLCLDKNKGELAVAVLQEFLDKYLAENKGKIDYIHERQATIKLAEQKNTIGFLLPPIDKNDFFKSIVVDGVLPRKTFSMGHAQEKRYYLEVRKIK